MEELRLLGDSPMPRPIMGWLSCTGVTITQKEVNSFVQDQFWNRRQGRFHNKLFTPIATQQVAATMRAIESYTKVPSASYSSRAQYFVFCARSTWQCMLIGWLWKQNHCSVMSCYFCNKLVLWGNRLLPHQPWPRSSCPCWARRQSAGDNIEQSFSGKVDAWKLSWYAHPRTRYLIPPVKRWKRINMPFVHLRQQTSCSASWKCTTSRSRWTPSSWVLRHQSNWVPKSCQHQLGDNGYHLQEQLQKNIPEKTEAA